MEDTFAANGEAIYEASGSEIGPSLGECSYFLHRDFYISLHHFDTNLGSITKIKQTLLPAMHTSKLGSQFFWAVKVFDLACAKLVGILAPIQFVCNSVENQNTY